MPFSIDLPKHTEAERLAAKRRLDFIKRMLGQAGETRPYDETTGRSPLGQYYDSLMGGVDAGSPDAGSPDAGPVTPQVVNAAAESMATHPTTGDKVFAQDLAPPMLDEIPGGSSEMKAFPKESELNIEGLTVDPLTREVVDTMDPEQRMMSIAVPADQGPLPMQQQLINKLELIRAQAAQKGREGSLGSAPGSQPISADWKEPTGGSFSQGTMTPEIQKRIDDNMMYAAESDENFASWMLQTPEIRERMRNDPGEIAESLRVLSAQKTADARRVLGMRIMELTKNESGLMSPKDASGYEILMGEKPPAGAVGIDRMQASQQIYNMRMSIDKMITQATQGMYGGKQAEIFRNYGMLATKLFGKADQQLQQGADPNMVVARLQAELASLQAPAGSTTDDLSTKGDPTQPLGVAQINR